MGLYEGTFKVSALPRHLRNRTDLQRFVVNAAAPAAPAAAAAPAKPTVLPAPQQTESAPKSAQGVTIGGLVY